ncbi:hypothetical protein EV562_1248 [Streptomyces sp. BK208]|uniref:hypothetical protein n=1 Tax=Streptomyces sp. BK208 TaxID=2512150 RepID=UPI00105CF102|nr:hypothetical protein [Streptomyces sp. BK208]TDT20963.1 hypothetical protein EV562_1248 [Streptomyces sp. BK208]
MSITQQYLLDAYRARQLGEPVPPAPGAHDLRLVREWHGRRRFRAVLAGRPAHGPVRRALRLRWTLWRRTSRADRAVRDRQVGPRPGRQG